MSNLWWLLALFSGMLMAGMIYANQIFKMPSSLMMTYRGIVQSLILLPFIPFFAVPTNPLFWLFVIIQGLMVAYNDKKTFLCSRKYGGEITASIKPYSVVMTFIFWLLIKPTQLFQMIDTPIRSLGIIVCLIASAYSLMLINKSKISKEAFFELLPALLLSVLIDANNKITTTYGASTDLISAIFYYCMMTAFFSGLPNIVTFVRKNDWHEIFIPKYIVGGFVVIFFSITSNIFKNSAMYYAQNPAYVGAVIAMYPIWIIIWNIFYYKFRKSEQYPRCNFVGIGILLLSVVLLILLQ